MLGCRLSKYMCLQLAWVAFDIGNHTGVGDCLTEQCRLTGHNGGRDAVGPPGRRVRAARGLLWHGGVHICVWGGQRGVSQLRGAALLIPNRIRGLCPPRWLDSTARRSTCEAATLLDVCRILHWILWHISGGQHWVAYSPSEALPLCPHRLWHLQTSTQDCCGVMWHM